MSVVDRPARRWYHASTRLEHCLRVIYRVDPAALRHAVAAGFEPTVFGFDDGTSASLVCAVAFVDRGFSFRFCPWLKVTGGQIDYAAYGSMGGERGVWFFGSSLDSRFVVLPQLAWRMPVHRDRVRVEAEQDSTTDVSRVRVTSAGSWGTAACDVDATGKPAGRLDGFASAAATAEVLTLPMVGWFARRPWRGSVRPAHQAAPVIARYSVWHPHVEAQACLVRHARFTVFEDLGLVTRDAEPHAALFHPRVQFDVHIPPRRLPRAGPA